VAEFSPVYEVGATALVLLGAAALYIALAIDLPDTRARGRLPESISFEAAHARAAGGLYLEIAGGGLLVVAGGGLLALARQAR